MKNFRLLNTFRIHESASKMRIRNSMNFANLNTEPLIKSLIEPFDFLNDDIIDKVSFLNKFGDKACMGKNVPLISAMAPYHAIF